MNLNNDALDRAILAMPLEEPPPNLRATILAATAYRPAPPFSVSEIVAAASIVAAAFWLLTMLTPAAGVAIANALLNVATLLWLGTGVAVTLWLEFFTVSQPLRSLFGRAAGRAGP